MLNTTDLLEPATDKPRDRRAWVVRFWDEPDGRSVTVGILGVLIVHLLLFLLGPRLLRMQDASSSAIRHAAQPERFTVHLAPDLRATPPAPKPPPPKNFVETNPNAPDNIPDNTSNFGARNQQAAQEKAQANAHGNRPQIDGRTDVHSTQVVSGKLAQPEPAIQPPAQPPRKTAALPRRAQNPLTGFEKLTGNDVDGYGSAVAPKLNNPTAAVQNPVTGVQDSPLFDGADQNQPPIDPQHPRARPVLQHIRARPAIFEENRFGTPNIGVVANDSRFNNYGAYLERMSEAVQAEWDEILSESRIDIPVSTVTIQFRINSNGEITEIIRTDSTSSSQGADSCKTALTARSPFGKWTDDMVAALGTSQVMTYTFYYEQP